MQEKCTCEKAVCDGLCRCLCEACEDRHRAKLQEWADADEIEGDISDEMWGG
jgi:hypothetical protein